MILHQVLLIITIEIIRYKIDCFKLLINFLIVIILP